MWKQVLDDNIFASDFESMHEGCEFTDSIVNAITDIGAECMRHQYFASIHTEPCNSLELIQLGLKDEILLNIKNQNAILNDLWLVPTHLSRSHWILFIVLIQSQRILILDSESSGSHVQDHLRVQCLWNVFFIACFKWGVSHDSKYFYNLLMFIKSQTLIVWPSFYFRFSWVWFRTLLFANLAFQWSGESGLSFILKMFPSKDLEAMIVACLCACGSLQCAVLMNRHLN